MKTTVLTLFYILFLFVAQAQTFEVPKNVKLENPSDYDTYEKDVV